MSINVPYTGPDSLPAVLPVFPLSGALLLPRGDMPLNIFEPRYLAMTDDAIAGSRLIVMVQPAPGEEGADRPPLAATGCAGRITAFQETGDGRLLITLTGVARVRLEEELPVTTSYRQCRVSAEPFAADFRAGSGADAVDRPRLLDTFRRYLEANDLKADWDSVNRATTESLVNALAMMSPFGPREKQALLEAEDLKARAEMLVAMTEMSLMRGDDDAGTTLQ